MKFLLSLSFLLFAVATSINASSFFAEGPTPPPILDATGAPLQFGVPYYMLPSMPVFGGGVILGRSIPLKPCSILIKLSFYPGNLGTPVVFSSAVQNVTGNITIGSELIISFYNLTRPNDESCGGSNSTTWGVMEERMNLAVGGEAMSNVFRLSLGGRQRTCLLKPVIPLEKRDFLVGIGGAYDWGAFLMAMPPSDYKHKLSFVFQEAKSTEEDEDDKPVIIQMPRKMSV